MVTTHHISLNGTEAFVLSVRRNGQEITLCGWTDRHRNWKKSDFVVLRRSREDGSTTRYRIIKMRPPGDPPDMYFMDCEYAPRTNRKKVCNGQRQ